MVIQKCTITLHDSLFFATREMGTLYETGTHLHNYALTYAMFGDSHIQVPYFCDTLKPSYMDDLQVLKQGQVYVTPAQPVSYSYILVTWKMGQVTYYRKSEQFGGRNYPTNYGRAKEIAPESTFQCFVLSTEPTSIPRWIRLGKWHSKARVDVEEIEVHEKSGGEYIAACPLNPLDVPAGVLYAFDIVSMPPASLVVHARCSGPHYEVASGIGIPVGLQYVFPAPAPAPSKRSAQRKK